MKSTLIVNMKKIIILLCFLFGATSYAQINISGCIQNLPDSISSVKIAYLKGNGLVVKQDFQIIKGCFSAPWENKERGIFIVYLDPQHSFDVVISDGNLNIEIDYNDIQNAVRVGPGNDEFALFKQFLSSQPEQEAIRTHLIGVRDLALKEFMLPQMLPLNPDTNVYWLRDHFWAYTNLTSPSTLINPFFEKNRDLYFERVLGHDPDTVIKHLKKLFNEPMDEQVRKVLVSTATYNYETSKFMGEDKVFVWLAQTFYNAGFADWMSKDDLAKIKEKSDGLSTELIGNPARDFAFDTPDKGRIKLSEVEATVTILYFWDSNCGHCKKETPRLKDLYDDYKERGVQVIAITLENEFSDWKKYIAEHKLDWINGFESDFERPNFLWYYYIPSTPKKLILDSNKIIIGKNLDIETTLRTFLDDYLSGLEL